MRDTAKFGAETTASEVAEGIDLSGTVALITGGSSGLGQETARVLAERRAHVILTARDVPKGEAGCAGDSAPAGDEHLQGGGAQPGPPENNSALPQHLPQSPPTPPPPPNKPRP